MNSKVLVMLAMIHYCSSKFSRSGIDFFQIHNQNALLDSPDSESRDFFPHPFFPLIGFGENYECSTEYGVGKCVPFANCNKNGGQNIGSCFWGFGSCCSSNNYCTTSRTSVSTNTAFLTGNPYDKGIRNCDFDFPKKSGVCQFRIDFEEFNLTPVNELGICSDEKLTIRGSTTVDETFELCGDNIGKTHIYLSYGISDKITVSIQTSSNSDITPLEKYKLQVRQIRCDSLERVSDHCLQNYNEPKGTVTSFGFPNSMISEQKYSVCIQSNQLRNSRQIKWEECKSSKESDSFLLSKHFSNINGNLRLPVVGASCNGTSYIEIVGENKHCGSEFQHGGLLVTSSFKPYELKVNFITDTSLPPPIIIFPANGLDQDSTICPFLLPDVIEQPASTIGIYECVGSYSRIFSGTMWCRSEEECEVKTHCVCAIIKSSPIRETNVKPWDFVLIIALYKYKLTDKVHFHLTFTSYKVEGLK